MIINMCICTSFALCKFIIQYNIIYNMRISGKYVSVKTSLLLIKNSTTLYY